MHVLLEIEREACVRKGWIVFMISIFFAAFVAEAAVIVMYPKWKLEESAVAFYTIFQKEVSRGETEITRFTTEKVHVSFWDGAGETRTSVEAKDKVTGEMRTICIVLKWKKANDGEWYLNGAVLCSKQEKQGEDNGT